MFLILFRSEDTYKCSRPMGGGLECGNVFSKLQDLKEHRNSCVWTCAICGKTNKKRRDIDQHMSKHRADEARREAIVRLMGDNTLLD